MGITFFRTIRDCQKKSVDELESEYQLILDEVNNKTQPDVCPLKDKFLIFLPDFLVKLGIDLFVYISYNLKLGI